MIATNGTDQAGTVSSGIVSVFKVVVGGANATATAPTTAAAVKAPAQVFDGSKEGEGDGVQKKLSKSPKPASQPKPEGQKTSFFKTVRDKLRGIRNGSKTSS